MDSGFKKIMKIPLQKCDDPAAYITVEVALRNIERPKKLEKSRRHHPEPMGLLETESFARE